MQIFDRVVNPHLLIRKMTINVCNIQREEFVPKQPSQPIQLDLFTDYEALRKEQIAKKQQEEKERRIQETILQIKESFGKNAILKGLNFAEGATMIERNSQIGGHKA